MSDAHRPEAPQIILKTDEDYRRAKQRLGEIQNARPGTVGELEIETIFRAIRQYEAQRYPASHS